MPTPNMHIMGIVYRRPDDVTVSESDSPKHGGNGGTGTTTYGSFSEPQAKTIFFTLMGNSFMNKRANKCNSDANNNICGGNFYWNAY